MTIGCRVLRMARFDRVACNLILRMRVEYGMHQYQPAVLCVNRYHQSGGADRINVKDTPCIS